MGRAHLSSQFGIDHHHNINRPLDHNHLSYATTSPSLPKFLDRPFDLDAELPDGPDVVYEAFLTPDQIRLNEERSQIAVRVPPRTDAPSPVESIDTDEATTDAPTEPLTRVPTPASPRPAPTAAAGMSVLELMEPLSNARAAALPALRQAVEEASTTHADRDTIAPLIQRLISILRPHISAAIAPFRSTMPDVEFLGNMFERSLILDVLSPEAGAFPRAAMLAALDEAEGLALPFDHAPAATEVDDDAGEDNDDDAVSDPGMDEEDLMADASYAASTTTRGQSLLASPTNAWSNWPSTTSDMVSSLVNRIPRPVTVSSRSTTPGSVMDLDTDDESSSRGSPGPVRSVYRSTHIPSFAPRIVRASVRPGPYPPPVIVASGTRSVHHDRFVPVDRMGGRATSPLR